MADLLILFQVSEKTGKMPAFKKSFRRITDFGQLQIILHPGRTANAIMLGCSSTDRLCLCVFAFI
jgi:hypothetical protein